MSIASLRVVPQRPSEAWHGTMLVLLSAFAFSLAGFFVRLIDTDVWTMLFWRGLFGGLFIAGWVLCRDGGRALTTLRRVDPGTDGGITWAGTLAGVTAAGVVTVAGCVAFRGDPFLFVVSWAGGVFGLFFDSLLGATLERAGWLNNDGVNFLSTASAAGFALAILAVLSHASVG